MKLFMQFNQVGVSVLIASHDLALIHPLHYRVIELSKGCIISRGKDSAEINKHTGEQNG